MNETYNIEIENNDIPSVEINVEEKDGISFVNITGDIDLNSAGELRGILTGLINKSKSQIIVNGKNVKYIDSSGIGVLIKAKSLVSKLNNNGKNDLVLINASEAVRKVLELTKLIGFFKVLKDEDDAITYFKS